jgi:hypothetical protein
MVVVGADPQEVAAGGRVVDAKAGAKVGAKCVRSGAKARDGVSGRRLVCVKTKARGLRWRFHPTAVTTTTTTVPGVVAPVVVSASADDGVRVTVAGMRPDTGVYSLQWVPYGQSFNSYQMTRATSASMSVPAGWFACNRTYTFRVFVMQADWLLADGHQTQNVTSHSTPFDVVMPACPAPATTTTTTTIAPAPATTTTTTTIAPAPATTTTTTTTTTIAPASCATGGVCIVGDTGPGGGKVFYVHASGTFACGATLASTCKYLEAAPSDHSSTAKWCSNNSSSLGVTATGIGSGMSNTATADSTCTSGAIQVAADYTNNGKTDWHLPSKDELNQMYVNKVAIGDFAIAIYWSSSENDAATAWYQGFGGGYQAYDDKEFSDRVRPVRAFGGTVACADGGACVVGDIGPGGGKVFYVHASGTFACGATLASTCKYLEAAPTTGTNSWTDARYRWSGNEEDFIGSTAQGVAVGTGYKNTEAIVTQSSTANRAGTIARAYRGPNNLSDWYLPSKNELNELYLERVRVGGLSGSRYWSSSENENFGNQAWFQFFSTGLQGNDSYKNADSYVRPVRAFG